MLLSTLLLAGTLLAPPAPAAAPAGRVPPVTILRAAGAAPAIAALGAARAPASPAGRRGDAVDRLRIWIERHRRSRRPLGGREEAELREIVGELRLLVTGLPQRRPAADLVLLDLASLGWAREEEAPSPPVPVGDGPPVPPPGEVHPVASIAGELWRSRLQEGAGASDWLANTIVARPEDQSAERRRTAARLLLAQRRPGTLDGLLAGTHAPEEEVRLAAAEALVGWREPRVHRLFIEALDAGRLSYPLVRAHLEAATGSLGPQAQGALLAVLSRLYFSDDWRDAARASGVVGALDAERAAPLLIEALGTWQRREQEDRGSRRIQHEILAELGRLSGRSLGPHPDRWARWWEAVGEGRVPLAEERDEEEGTSRAAFFGLRPNTDRVVFVVDRSGSMRTRMGTGSEDRWSAALRELFRFLESSGPGTRFGLVLFNHEALRWRNGLVPASAKSLQAARAWLARKSHQPTGGTQLGLGVLKAVEADRRGRIDLDRLDADTVIVLCDGEETGPTEWLDPLVEKAVDEAQLVFHCVRIGRSGDGVLEALAARTGGDFLQIDG